MGEATEISYSAIKDHLKYWGDYFEHNNGTEQFRATHDLDCVLTDGNLYADTIISMWLPIRYILDNQNTDRWNIWKYYERESLRPVSSYLKAHKPFLSDLANNLEDFIPDKNILNKLNTLTELSRTRANVMILPYRRWNSERGRAPYWEYMPHFLADKLDTNDEAFLSTVQKWIDREKLSVFFAHNEDGTRDISINSLRDLMGTGSIYKHNKPNIELMLDNYIDILKKRSRALDIANIDNTNENNNDILGGTIL
jgi:hypothetical protein